MATAKEQNDRPARLTANERELLPVLRERMADSLLPGDVEMPRKALADAAHFLLEAARIRPEGVGTILIRSLPGARVTRVAVVNKDMPFLVDSVAAAIASQGIAIDSL